VFKNFTLSALVFSLLLTSCNQDEKRAETIETLREELKALQTQNQPTPGQIDSSRLRLDLQGEQEKNKQLKFALAQKENELQSLKKDVLEVQQGLKDLNSLAQKVKLAPPAAAKETTPKNKTSPKTTPSRAVVIINGDDSSGTGFFVRSGRVTYLYTAAHVLSGNKSLTFTANSGREYKDFGTLEVAEGMDLARMRVNSSVPHALSLPKMRQISSKDEILAIGNAGGGDVLTYEEGKVKGIGPRSFEIDAEIIPGNSGGPIVAENGKTVFGVVTHLRNANQDIWSRGTRFAKARAYGARLDRKISWKKVKLTTFMKEYDKIERLDRITRLLFAIAAIKPHLHGLDMGAEVTDGIRAIDVLNENSHMKAVKGLLNVHGNTVGNGIKDDSRVIRKRYTRYYEAILTASEIQMAEIKGYGLSPYHKEMAQESYKWRDKAIKALNSTLRNANL